MTELSAEVKAHFKDQVYSHRAPPETIRRHLDEIVAYDAFVNAQLSKWGTFGCVGALAALGCFFAGAAMLPSPIGKGLWGLGGGVLIFAVVAGIKYSSWNTVDLDDDRLAFVKSVLEALRRDMGKDADMEVHFDFDDPTRDSKKTGSGKIGPWSVTYYENNWLLIEGRFLDKTSFRITLLEKIQERSRWKTNARGKTKHKFKTKVAKLFGVQLRPSTRKYGTPERLNETLKKAVKLPPGASCRKLSGDEKKMGLEVQLKGDTDNKASLAVLFGMLLSCYQALNLGRDVIKKAA